MNRRNFDAISGIIANRLSRRAVLRRLGGAGLATTLAASAGADWARGASQEATPDAAADASLNKPSAGWDLHIDAKLHFPGDPEAIAHHYCKPVAGGLIECLLFDSDEPDARLVGVEVIVDGATYEELDAAEQEFWHYHKEEIPKVEATLPDLSAEEAAQVVAQIKETYGKLYILWDPTQNELPTGEPSLTIRH